MPAQRAGRSICAAGLGLDEWNFVNGFRLNPQTPVYVSLTDQITLGPSVAFQWPQQTESAPVSRQTIHIGRGPHNEIRLDNPMISWSHARITAKLRTDFTDPEIERRIDTVLTKLGIQDEKNTIIGSPERKVLSGGQRKRVNIAMDLIAEAPVVFLDEPTSGLSSYDAENVVQVLKDLSKSGTTVVTTIHQPSLNIYKQFDSLIMISRDRGGSSGLAYFGPAYPDAIEFFNPAATPNLATPLQPASIGESEWVERTPLRTSFAILAGMLAFWISVALVFLKMRDLH